MTTSRHSDTALKLWVVLSRSYAAIAEHAKAHAAAHDLTAQEFGVLEALYHKGDMFLGELQEKILVSSGGVTYLVDRLAEKGLVERKNCQADRRARYASLTTKGKALIGKIFPEHAAWLDNALGGLTVAERHEATRLLKDLGRHAATAEPGTT